MKKNKENIFEVNKYKINCSTFYVHNSMYNYICINHY